MAIQEKGYLVAEIGNNHDGKYDKAVKLIEEAKEAGAHCVKFQCINYENWIDGRLEVFGRARETGFKTQLERLKAIELTVEEYEMLAIVCEKVGIDFSCTIFDQENMNRLKKYLSFAKVSSGEIYNKDTLDVAISSGKQVVISTGLTRSITDVTSATEYINQKDTYIMHCVSRYPSSIENYEWNNLGILQQVYGKEKIGLSDHTCGNEASILSIGKGCRLIERHFKLQDEAGNEGDKRLSLTKIEMRKLVDLLNIVSKAEKKEEENIYSNNCENNKSWKQLVRKAHTIVPVKKGTTITKENVIYKISGEGEYTSFSIECEELVANEDIGSDVALNRLNTSVKRK